ncbi:hypothetical protein ACHAPV_009644 [Trichoderma viride]
MKPPNQPNGASSRSFMSSVTEFYRCQIGGETVINYAYTDFPLRLLVKDVYYFFAYCWALPWVFFPIHPFGSGELDELYPSRMNIFCLIVHFFLLIFQVAFLLALPFAIFFPAWMGIAAIVGFHSLNRLACMLLNGKEIIFHSDEKYAKARPEHEHEQWVFLNGVSTGEHWMKTNLNRLAITFGRPILGIHNRTSGMVFDVIECLIQRNFSYATGDIRVCYRHIKDILYNPKKTKVVFIMHSQGAIEGGMVLDWLLQEMPQDLLAKLEVYTFGSAANHFNNPHRHVISQDLTRSKPFEAMQTIVSETTYETPATTPLEVKKDPMISTNVLRRSSSIASYHTASAAKDRAIGHIEHYTHNTDFVAIWGILHFATNRMASRQLPRFLGRLFNRSNGHGGHLFVQHYLDGLFPLKRDPETGEFVGVEETNAFMEEVIKFGVEGTAMENAREAFEISYGGTGGFGTGEISTPIEVYDQFSARKKQRKDVKVKELSRLWMYRNGRSPPDISAALAAELAGIDRRNSLL